MTQLRLLAITLCVLTAAVACKPPAPTHHNRSPHTSGLVAGALTYDGPTDRYAISGDADSIQITAPRANTGGNLRLAIAEATTPASIDQQACVTWAGPTDSIIQPGIVLRARITATGTQAIMISQNIWLHARQGVNVHLVDSNADRPLTLIGQTDMTAGLGGFYDRHPLPWRFCARAVGRELRVKAWATSVLEEPSWTDPTHTTTIAIPTAAPSSGQPGVYIGHLRAGDTTTLTDLATDNLPGTPDNTRWADAHEWATRLLQLTQGHAATAAEIDTYAHLVIDGNRTAAAAWAGVAGTSRTRAAHEIHQQILGTPAPGNTTISGGADQYAANLLAQIPGTNHQWITAVYQQVLRRQPSTSDLAWWTNQLANSMNRTQAGRLIYRSTEHARLQTADAIASITSRAATRTEVDTHSPRFAALGHDPVRMRAHLVTAIG